MYPASTIHLCRRMATSVTVGNKSSNYGMRLDTSEKDTHVIYINEQGRYIDFLKEGDAYIPPASIYDALTENTDGTFNIKRKDQTEYHFTAEGVLAEIVDRNSNVLAITYGGSGTSIS